MKSISRRNFITLAATSIATIAATKKINAKNILPYLIEPKSGNDPGPSDIIRNQENPDIINPPNTDQGTLPNLKFSFSDAHIRNERGGWTRQITQRELGVSKTIAGVNMRLNNKGIRELHWHKEAEWSYMLYGKAQITAIDQYGHYYINNVNQGDLWYFPPGIPHSIQGLEPNGCEFILVFDDGNFDEDSTFLLSDWLKHVPTEILEKNFKISSSAFSNLPNPETKYIFLGHTPTNEKNKTILIDKQSKIKFTHKMLHQKPIITKKGTVRITDSSIFKISKTISAALVELDIGAIRELHWHPNSDEWQFYINGIGRMGVFASSNTARTFNFRSGDVGYIPCAMGHYIENLGNEKLQFLEIFRNPYYMEISLNQWLALTPSILVKDHLNVTDNFINKLNDKKEPII